MKNNSSNITNVYIYEYRAAYSLAYTYITLLHDLMCREIMNYILDCHCVKQREKNWFII